MRLFLASAGVITGLAGVEGTASIPYAARSLGDKSPIPPARAAYLSLMAGEAPDHMP